MKPITEGNAFEHALHALAQRNDPALLEAYRRYMQRLEELLGKDKLNMYAHVYQQGLEQFSQSAGGGVPTAEERTMYDTVTADPEVQVRYDHYIALAKEHGLIVPKSEDAEPPATRKHFWSRTV
jgi:hypothetical protein